MFNKYFCLVPRVVGKHPTFVTVKIAWSVGAGAQKKVTMRKRT